MRGSVDCHLLLFHHLEQCCLGFGRSAVDFVDEYQVGKNRPLLELECRIADIENAAARNIGRHEVGCELDAVEAQGSSARQEVNSQRFGYAGHAFNQHMAIAKKAGQHEANHFFLPYQHPRELGLNLAGNVGGGIFTGCMRIHGSYWFFLCCR